MCALLLRRFGALRVDHFWTLVRARTYEWEQESSTLKTTKLLLFTIKSMFVSARVPVAHHISLRSVRNPIKVKNINNKNQKQFSSFLSTCWKFNKVFLHHFKTTLQKKGKKDFSWIFSKNDYNSLDIPTVKTYFVWKNISFLFWFDHCD